MAVTAFNQGTQTTTVIGSEYFLPATPFVNVAGTYTLHVDTVNMAAGDVLEVRAYQMVLTGGTSRVAYLMTYYGLQPTDDKVKISVPISNELTDTGALKFSIKQTFGSSRDYYWKVLKY